MAELQQSEVEEAESTPYMGELVEEKADTNPFEVIASPLRGSKATHAERPSDVYVETPPRKSEKP